VGVSSTDVNNFTRVIHTFHRVAEVSDGVDTLNGMFDSSAWAGVIPAIVVSVATTLITLGISSLVGKRSERLNRTKRPVEITRTGATSWSINNRSKRILVGLGGNVESPAPPGGQPDYRQIEGYGGVLHPQSQMWIGDLNHGDVVSVNWSVIRRGRMRDFSARARIVNDVDVYVLDPSLGGAIGYGTCSA
jgi:hypothetical protein